MNRTSNDLETKITQGMLDCSICVMHFIYYLMNFNWKYMTLIFPYILFWHSCFQHT